MDIHFTSCAGLSIGKKVFTIIIINWGVSGSDRGLIQIFLLLYTALYTYTIKYAASRHCTYIIELIRWNSTCYKQNKFICLTFYKMSIAGTTTSNKFSRLNRNEVEHPSFSRFGHEEDAASHFNSTGLRILTGYL